MFSTIETSLGVTERDINARFHSSGWNFAEYSALPNVEPKTVRLCKDRNLLN